MFLCNIEAILHATSAAIGPRRLRSPTLGQLVADVLEQNVNCGRVLRAARHLLMLPDLNGALVCPSPTQ